ncbi:MAG TPA: nucleotide disphospho-sugar-binding domain-containing protein, partial [Jiangellaceae bacterium]
PLALVVTVGQQNDPAVLGPQPDNVVVRLYVPQAELLPHCQAVVTHGGSGTMLGALAQGLPLLVVPQGADQYANADAVVAASAGRRLGRDETTGDAVRDSVRSLLDDPGFRRAALRVQAEIRAMPTAAQAITRIEMLLARASDP